MFVERPNPLSVLHVPEPDPFVLAPGKGRFPVMGKGDAMNLGGVAFEAVKLTPRLDLPEPYRVIGAAGQDVLAIGSEGDAVHGAFMANKPPNFGGPLGRGPIRTVAVEGI